MTSFSDHAVGLAWTQTWQILAVAIIAASLAWAIGKRHPHMSYLLWMLVLVKALTPPVFVGPISIFNWPAESSQATPAVEYSGQNGVAVDLPSAQATSSSPVGIARDASIVTGTSWTALLALLWTCGTLLVIAFHGVAHTLFRRRLGRASRDSEEELTAQVAAIAKRVGLRRPPRALITTLPTSPAVFGVRRPIIVLPESALDDELSHNLEAILAHELIHVRRRDPLHALLQLVAVSFWWWNPVVWFASRLATRERERCCDEEVLGTLGYPGEFYAQCMLDMLRAQARPVVASPALGLKALPVTRRRLESIMRPGKHFHPRTPRWLWAAAIVLGLALLPGGRAAPVDARYCRHRVRAFRARSAGQAAATSVSDLAERRHSQQGGTGPPHSVGRERRSTDTTSFG